MKKYIVFGLLSLASIMHLNGTRARPRCRTFWSRLAHEIRSGLSYVTITTHNMNYLNLALSFAPEREKLVQGWHNVHMDIYNISLYGNQNDDAPVESASFTKQNVSDLYHGLVVYTYSEANKVWRRVQLLQHNGGLYRATII